MPENLHHQPTPSPKPLLSPDTTEPTPPGLRRVDQPSGFTKSGVSARIKPPGVEADWSPSASTLRPSGESLDWSLGLEVCCGLGLLFWGF